MGRTYFGTNIFGMNISEEPTFMSRRKRRRRGGERRGGERRGGGGGREGGGGGEREGGGKGGRSYLSYDMTPLPIELFKWGIQF